MIDGPVGLACLEKFRDKNLIGLAWGENGMRQITNSRRPIRTPNDFKGLKLVLPQSAVIMIGLEAVGAMSAPFRLLNCSRRCGRAGSMDRTIRSQPLRPQIYGGCRSISHSPTMFMTRLGY